MCINSYQLIAFKVICVRVCACGHFSFMFSCLPKPQPNWSHIQLARNILKSYKKINLEKKRKNTHGARSIPIQSRALLNSWVDAAVRRSDETVSSAHSEAFEWIKWIFVVEPWILVCDTHQRATGSPTEIKSLLCHQSIQTTRKHCIKTTRTRSV